MSEPIELVEVLHHSVVATGWTDFGIRLSDGRIVRLPGIRRLPEVSKALGEALSSGIELSRDGRVYGLVRVWHWCGNDPVSRHIARVDISRLLIFLGEGEHIAVDPPYCKAWCKPSGADFTENGWNPGDFRAFAEWNEAVDWQLGAKPSNNRLKQTARGRSGAKSLRRTRAAA